MSMRRDDVRKAVIVVAERKYVDDRWPSSPDQQRIQTDADYVMDHVDVLVESGKREVLREVLKRLRDPKWQHDEHGIPVSAEMIVEQVAQEIYGTA